MFQLVSFFIQTQIRKEYPCLFTFPIDEFILDAIKLSSFLLPQPTCPLKRNYFYHILIVTWDGVEDQATSRLISVID